MGRQDIIQLLIDAGAGFDHQVSSETFSCKIRKICSSVFDIIKRQLMRSIFRTKRAGQH